MADTFNLISMVSFVLAAVFFLLSAIMFFKFNIRKLIGDLSGRNARKSIDGMKREVKVCKQQPVDNTVYKREIKESSKALQTDVQSCETKPLDEDVTAILENEFDGIMLFDKDITTTTVLSESEMGTTVLSENQLILPEKRFVLSREITFIHGDVTL